jgi:kynurenine formamidase
VNLDVVLGELGGSRRFDLSVPISADTPLTPHMVPFRMAYVRRHGDVVRDGDVSGSTEMISMGAHTGTHVDALAHISHRGRLHGGLPVDDVMVAGRYASLGVEAVEPFIGRGVLLDVPRWLELDATDLPGRATTADDLAAVIERAQVEIRAGDAVFVRSGWMQHTYAAPADYVGHTTGVPGPDIDGARLLTELGVALVGSDTLAFEHLAPGLGHTRLPVHRHLLVDSGVPIVEHLMLDDLAAASVTEFLLALLPLPIVGATASPLRPIALASR